MTIQQHSIANYDFFNKAVQSGLTEGQFVNAESILICCGPPNLASMANTQSTNLTVNQTVAFPLGKVQQFSLGQNTAFQRIFEIGSKRSYFISGRSVGTIGLGRAYYHGPSLLRAAYAYYSNAGGTIDIPALYNNGNVMDNVNPHDVQIAPGSGVNGNLWLNLASDVFSQPMGFLILIRDSNDQTVGAFYVEYCVIPTHGFQFDSQSVVVQEQASFLFERLVPINLSGIVEVPGAVGGSVPLEGIIGHAVGINS